MHAPPRFRSGLDAGREGGRPMRLARRHPLATIAASLAAPAPARQGGRSIMRFHGNARSPALMLELMAALAPRLRPVPSLPDKHFPSRGQADDLLRQVRDIRLKALPGVQSRTTWERAGKAGAATPACREGGG
jgi:hypothetical protein